MTKRPVASAPLLMVPLLTLTLAGNTAAAHSAGTHGRFSMLATAAVAAPPKPIVVLFLSGLPTNVRPGEPDIVTTRTRSAARAMRDRFVDTGAVEPVVYDPEMPLFVRAMHESNIKPVNSAAPSTEEEVAIGKAVGALYVIEVITHDPERDQGASALDLEMRAVSVESRKVWDDRAIATANGGGRGPLPAGTTSNGETVSATNAVASAANTLVMRFLGGPMRDYFKDVVPPSMLPPQAPIPVTPGTTPAPGTPPATPDMPPSGSGAGGNAPTAPTNTPPPAGLTPAGPAAPNPIPVGPPAPGATPPTVPPPTVPSGTTPPATTGTGKPAPTPGGATAPAPAPAASRSTEAITDSSQTGTDAQAEALRQQGEQQITAGDADAAVLSLRRAVNLAPTSPRMRISLIHAYVAAKRYPDAIAEGRRALTITPAQDQVGRLEVTRAMAEALRQQGDGKAARALYEDIIAAQPASSNWARIALGDLLYSEGDTDGAESLYRAVLKLERDDKDGLLGLARVLAIKGDFEGALKQMTAALPAEANGDAALARYATARSLFDDGTVRVAQMLRKNRTAYQSKSLGREPFYKATEAQSTRITGLLMLLKSVPPPESAGPDTAKAHRKRIFAASLLSQAVAEMLSELETGKQNADSQATVLLDEFDREMAEAGALPSGGADTGSSSASSTP